MMINRLCNMKRQTGFSLVELTVVLLIITLLASVAVRETSELAFQTRYEQTKERLEMIRQAILGNPKLIVNGQQAVSGFVADMGRLPQNLRELIDNSTAHSDCDLDNTKDLDGDGNPALDKCLPWSTAGNPGSLGAGWRGPYLRVSNNPDSQDAYTDGWGNVANDKNYGWNFINASPTLTVQSKGKNQALNAADTGYDEDYPTSQPMINSLDWLIPISEGISVNFKKTAGNLPSDSYCSDPSKITKSTCTAAGGTWIGGCNMAGFYNKSSCTTASGSWVNCSSGTTSETKTTCEAAGKEWYGEGFGCSNQAKPTKDSCLSDSGTWISCTDSTKFTENDCLTAGEFWYGDTIFNNALSMQKVCMKVFYRKSDSTIGMLVSDENITNDSPTVHFDPKSVIADGSFQSLRFINFRDSASNVLVTELPIGTSAIGIYKHDGSSCTDSFYPSDRQNPMQVDFHAHAGLPVINW